jgi:hypothetical protein
MMKLLSMRVAVVALSLRAAMSFTGCIVVGHSSGGGWFVWPGGLGLLVVVLVVLFLLRGRR